MSKSMSKSSAKLPNGISNEQLRLIVENANEAIFVLQNNSLVYSNSKAVEIIGYPVEKIRNTPFTEFIHPDDRSMVMDNYKKRLSGKNIQNIYSFRLINSAEKVVWTQVNSVLIQWNGKAAVLVFATDITALKATEESVKISEERYYDLLGTIPDGVFVINIKGIVTQCNRRFEELVGYDRSEIIGKHITDLPTVKKQDLPQYLKLIGSIFRGHKEKTTEFKWIHKNGTERLGEARYKIRKEPGKVPELFIIFHDITLQKLADKALKESEEKYKKIVEIAHDAIVIHTDGKIVYANPATVRLSGANSINDLIGKPVIDFVHPDYRAVTIQRIQKLEKGENIAPVFKEVFLHFDGSPLPVEVSGSRTTFNGKPSIQLFIRDIRDHLKQQEALVESERKWRELFENMLDGWFSNDINGKYLEYNQAFLDMLGYPAEELRQKTHREITPEKWHGFEDEIVNKILKQKGFTGIYEKEYLHKDGRIIPVEISIHQIKDDNGKPIGTWGIAHNIIEKKASQDALAIREFLNQITLKNISDAIFITNDRGKFTFICTDPESLFGYSKSELLKMGNVSKLFEIGKIDTTLLKTRGEIQNIDYAITDKSGTKKVILVNIKNVAIGDGTRLFTCREITDRKKAEIALRRSENRYRVLFDTAPAGIITVDPEGKIREVNQEMLKFLGSPSAEQTKAINMFTFPPLVEAGISRSLQECLETGNSFVCEHPYQSKWGKSVVLHYHLAAIKDDNGANIGVQAIALDYTKYRQAEDELRKSEEFLSTIFNYSNIGVYLIKVTADGNYIYEGINPIQEKLLAISNDFVKGKRPEDLVSLLGKEAVDSLLAIFDECVQKKESLESESFVPEGPAKGWWFNQLRPIMDDQNRVIRLIGNGMKTTELKEAQSALRASEARFSTFTNHIPAAVFIKDQECKTLYLNRYMQRLFNADDSWLGKTFADMIPGEIGRQILDDDRQALRTGFIEKEKTIIDPTGKKRILYSQKFRIEQPDGPPILGGIAWDITRLKDTESALQESQSRFLAFMDHIPGGVFIKDHASKFVYLNKYMHDNFSTDDRWIGKSTDKLFPEETSKRMIREDQAALEKGMLVIEEPVEDRFGNDHIYQTYKFRIDQDGGKPLLGGITMDITERKKAAEAIRENERFLQNTFDAIQDGISVLDRDLTIIKTNQWMSEQYAHNKPLVGKKCYQAYQQRDSICPWCPSVKALQTGATHTQEVPYPNEENPTGWIDLSAFPLKNAQGEVTGVIEYVKDISKRKKAEEALRKSEAQYRELIDGMIETVWIIDFDGNLLDVNHSATEVLGYTQKELLDIGLYGIDSSLKKEAIRALAGAMPKDETQMFETSHRKKDGTIFPVEVYSSLVTYHGKPAILSIARDITDRKRAEKQLQESEEKHRLINQNIPVLVYAALPDEKSTNIFLSGQAQELTGYNSEELLNDNSIWEKMIHPDDVEKVLKAISAHRKAKSILNIEYRIITKSGKQKWIHDKAKPLLDENETIILIQGFMEDITERKQAEEALKNQEHFISAVADTNPALIYVYDMESNSNVYSNTGIEKLLGYSAPEIQAMGSDMFPRLIHPDDLPGVIKFQKEILAAKDEDVLEIEYRMRHRNGKWVTLHSYERVFLRNPNGSVKQKVGVALDVTERKQTEEELHSSRYMLQTVLNTLPTGVFWKDTKLNYLGANRAWLETVGVESVKDIIGKSDYDLPWEKSEADSFRADDTKIIESGFPRYNIIEPYSRADGTHAWAKTNKALLRSNDGQIIGVLGTYEDITTQKQAEDQLHQKITELERFNKVMVGRENRMIELKQEINELCDKLGIPHKYQASNDINNMNST